MTGRVRELDGSTAVLEAGPGESLIVPDASSCCSGVGASLDLTVRPEKIVMSLQAPTPGWCALRGRVNEVVYLGTSTQYAVTTRIGAELSVFVQNASDASDVAQRGAEVWLSWRPDHSLALAPTPAAPMQDQPL
jgi:spermidine/putrescine transport system ATP-binding protein